jgi:tetratricopeptide (TPR) repeat protein
MTWIMRAALCVALSCVGIIAAMQRSNAAPVADQLGTVKFPNSCNAAAQPSILSGVAFLHSFQYLQSKGAFEQAATADPKCAIAHWGEAMSLYHQLWENPGADTLSKGRADLAAAKKLKTGTPLERGYIDAATIYFKDDSKLTYEDRVRAYSEAMAKVHAANPNDTDAAAFYALSLVSLAYKDEKNADADRKEALAILQPLFVAHPDHPGVAHYIIHASDTPELAPQGLDAARRYAKIAPDSSHAVHMPSHIFTRLGLWDESIDSNVAASALAAKATVAHQSPPHYQFHAMDYLAYSYVQLGQGAKAQQVIDDLKTVPGADAHDIAMHEAFFSARNALDMREWKQAADLPVLDLGQNDLVPTYWAKSIGAARSGDAAAAKENLSKLIPALDAQRAEDVKMGETPHDGKPTEQLEAEGWVAFAEGRADDAVASLRAAAARQEGEDFEAVVIPAREMLADLLLELKRPDEALKEYQVTMKEAPNRFDSQFGAAIAANLSGDKGAARDYTVHLQHRCGPTADRDEIRQLSMVIDRRWPH